MSGFFHLSLPGAVLELLLRLHGSAGSSHQDDGADEPGGVLDEVSRDLAEVGVVIGGGRGHHLAEELVW